MGKPKKRQGGGGGVSESQIRQAYKDVLGRNADSGGLKNYMQAAKNGWKGIKDIGGVIADLKRSSEYRNRGASTAPSSGGHGGGVSAPSVPTAGETARELSSAYTQDLDKVASKEFETYSKYAPQYAQKQRDILKELYPNQSGLGELIAKEVGRRLEVEDYAVPEALKNQYQRQRRASDADRGLFRSGMSGRSETEDLTKLGIQMRQADISTALALDSGLPKVSPMQGIPGQNAALQFTGMGFNSRESALNRSLSTAQGNQADARARYGINVNADLAYANLDLDRSRLDETIRSNTGRIRNNRSPNQWVTLAGEGASDLGFSYLKDKFNIN